MLYKTRYDARGATFACVCATYVHRINVASVLLYVSSSSLSAGILLYYCPLILLCYKAACQHTLLLCRRDPLKALKRSSHHLKLR